MKITGWHIDGFGVFRDYEVRDLGEGLTVFEGPNEAGKSTLLAFVRRALFGASSEDGDEPGYRPLLGGRHGGRIYIASSPNHAKYEIEYLADRQPPLRVLRADGEEVDAEEVRALLGAVDERLFRSIFAFSLAELQSFDTLTPEGIRDRIFSAGIAGAGRSARDAVAELERRATGLLKPRGHATINELVAELSRVHSKIETARKAVREYPDVIAQEQRLAAEISRLGQQSDEVRRRRTDLMLLVELWPVWDELQAIRRELEALDPIDEFSVEAEPRLAAVLQETRGAEDALEELTTAQGSALERRQTLEPDEALAAVAGDVDRLHESLSLHRNLLQQMPGFKLKLFRAKETVDEQLRMLGPEWDEARVEAFNRSIPQLEEVRRWEERLDRANAEIDRLGHDSELATGKRDEVQAVRDAMVASIADVPEDPVREDQEKIVRRLRSNLAEVRVEEAEAASREAILKDRERAIRSLESEAEPDTSLWALATAWLLAGGIVGAVWQIESDELTWLVLFLASVVVAGLTYIFWQRRSWKVAQRKRRDADLETLRSERDTAAAAFERHARTAGELSGRVATDSEALGLRSRPTAQEIDGRDAQLDAWRQRRGKLTEAQRDFEIAVNDVSRLQAALENAQRGARDDEGRWTDWKRAAHLPEALSPRGMLDYFEALRLCQDAIQARKAAREEALQVAHQLGQWDEPVRAVLAATGMTATMAEEQLVEEVLALRRRCERDRETRTALTALDSEIRDRAARIAAIESRLRKVRDDRARLLAEAGAEDESAFHSRLATFRRRSALRGEMQNLERQLSVRLGHGSDPRALRERLIEGGLDTWRADAAAAGQEATQLQAERDRAVVQHRDAERTRLAVLESDDLPRLNNDRAALEAELAGAIREWRVTTMARSIINETLRDFERTRQPIVLGEASRIFSRVTDGRYVSVAQDETGRELMVIDRTGTARRSDVLSRGTAEQLYLCIRLALAAEFAREHHQLPLVIDDVLVNFDPERARAMATVMADFAKLYQMFVFTCHPSTREMLVAASPGVRVIELPARATPPA